MGFGGSDLALPPTTQTTFNRLFYLFQFHFPPVSHGDHHKASHRVTEGGWGSQDFSKQIVDIVLIKVKFILRKMKIQGNNKIFKKDVGPKLCHSRILGYKV